MTLNHLETMTSTQSHSSRKSQRVYRSPSDPNEPSPFSKEKKRDSQQLQHSDNNKLMEIDAEDAEAGNILMALKNHQFNMNPSSSSSSTYDEKVKCTFLFILYYDSHTKMHCIAHKK